MSEIDRLNADAGTRAIKANELEKRYTEQQLYIDLNQELMTGVEKYISDMVYTILYYIIIYTFNIFTDFDNRYNNDDD